MGSFIEINDTLQLTTEQGFPADLFNRDQHVKNPVQLADVADRIFHFKNKPSARIGRISESCKISSKRSGGCRF